jgi:hypothetical protein
MSAFHPLRTFDDGRTIVFVRFLLLILPLLLAGACKQTRPVDCTQIDFEAVMRCYEKNASKGEVARSVACLPFSERLTTSGTWVLGLEKNTFFEGSGTPHAEVMWKESTGASLIVDEGILNNIPWAKRETRAFRVDVVGRRALCAIDILNSYPIAVEKLTVKGHIGSR